MIPRLRTAFRAHRARIAAERMILAAAADACEMERLHEAGLPRDDERMEKILRDAIDLGIHTMTDRELTYWASSMDAAAAMRADIADPHALHRPPVLGCGWDREWAESLGVAL